MRIFFFLLVSAFLLGACNNDTDTLGNTAKQQGVKPDTPLLLDGTHTQSEVDSAGYAPQQVIVKFKSEGQQRLTQCLTTHLQKGQSFRAATADQSKSLDTLMSKYKVSGARALLRGRTGLNTKVAKKRFQDRIAKSRFGTSAATLEDLTNVYLLQVDSSESPVDVAASFASDPHVEFAQPNYLVTATYTPDDPYLSTTGSWEQSYADLWSLDILGAQTAWDSARGDGVLVAVVDSGVDRNHPDLIDNIWTNPNEIENGIDDDENGYIDDIYGWNFHASTPETMDDDGHGTHVAGTIAAQDNNGIGIAGVAPDAHIMAVKGLGQGGGHLFNLAAAIVYAAENGASVINNSWGCVSPCPSNPLAEDAVKTAHDLGAVVVFAAGNSTTNVSQFSPVHHPCTIAVTATDPDEQRAGFSNWGRVDVGAPGAGTTATPPDHLPIYGILSLRSNGCDGLCVSDDLGVGEAYLRLGGTSMAAPHVAGLAALIRSQHPEYTPEQVRQVIRRSSVDLGDVGFDTDFGYGRIDAATALVEPEPLEAVISGPYGSPVGSVDFVPVTGMARGTDFASYTLELGQGENPEDWTQFASSTTPVDANGELTNWDVSGLVDGIYSLRLTATTTDGRSYEDLHLVELERIRIDTPVVKSIIRGGGEIVIEGVATSPLFESYSVRVEKAANGHFVDANITLPGGGTAPVVGGILATWDTTDLAANHYRIIVEVTNTDGTKGSRDTTILIDPWLKPGWPLRVDTTGNTLGFLDQPAAADVDGNGTKELLFCRGEYLRIIDHAGNPLPGWPQKVAVNEVRDHCQLGPVVGDVDGDGELEVAVGTNHQENVVVWNADGSVLEGWPKQFKSWPMVTIADIDGDSIDEIIVATVNDTFAYTGEGTQVPGWPAYTKGVFPALPAVGDLDGDGTFEVVVSKAYEEETVINVFDAAGDKMPGWPVTYSGVPGIYKAPRISLGDIDGDKDLDIVAASSNGQVRAYHYDGTLIDGWPVGHTDARRVSEAVLGDLDGDGALEVLVGMKRNNRTYLYVWRGTGQNYTSWPLIKSPSIQAPAVPILADLDGDFLPEIITSLGIDPFDFAIQAYSRTKNPLSQFWRPAFDPGAGETAAPIIDDLDGDGLLEMVWLASTVKAEVFAWDLPVSADNTIPWGQYRQNPGHTAAAPPPEDAGIPVASFTYSCEDLTCSFTDTSTDSKGSIVEWSWSFDATGTSKEQHPVYIYAEPGTYWVYLGITDDDGHKDSISQQIEVGIASQCGEFGIAYVDDNTLAVYHQDLGWSGHWNYVCLNGLCFEGELKDGYYHREFDGVLGTTYDIEFRVQDDATGQFVTTGQDTFSQDSCQLGGPACTSDAQCDDGLFCNGTESCVGGVCQAGQVIECPDNGCETGICDENEKGCVYTPDNAQCDDGLFCNGEEQCVAGSCESGAAVVCNDNVACTLDSCSNAQGTCVFEPDHGVCDNGLYCDGAEVCDSELGCVDGAAPCSPENCDEELDQCSGSNCGEFGIAYVNDNTLAVYHEDLGWTGSWHYLCLNNECLAGINENGYYRREISATLGTTYDITFKVQDDATGQYIIDGRETFDQDSCLLP